MDLGQQVTDWFVQNMGGVVFLIIGSVLGFLGSWAVARSQWKAQVEDERRRKVEHDRQVWRQSLANLVAELQQNQEHQIVDNWIVLETEAYKQMRSLGLLGELDPNLQLELRRLYSHIHQKNDLNSYYQMYIPSLTPDERKRDAPELLKKIDEAKKEVENGIFKILPKFLELQKKSG